MSVYLIQSCRIIRYKWLMNSSSNICKNFEMMWESQKIFFYDHYRSTEKKQLPCQTEAETGRIFYSPPRPAPPLVFILRPRPAPLFQGTSINGIGTKGRNWEDFLLPASPRPVSFSGAKTEMLSFEL